ncbi:DNA ligase 1 isoform X2 [Alosa pseudoharengus]|uniref:DNA ligase 1 isoform X2 n=1 Tax=Alosa pseudoharengus TaxID=34774 RepID=UPI003F88C7BA
MQRSIASFFQPMKGKEKNDGQVKVKSESVKSPLKLQNGNQEVDSPVKKLSKRSRQILDSDDEEQTANQVKGDARDKPTKEQAANQVKGDAEDKPTKEHESAPKATPTPLSPKTPVSPATPMTPVTPAALVASATPVTPSSESPSGVPKRRTARKQFPKRKLENRSDGETEKEEKEGGKEEEKEAREEGGQESKRARTEQSQERADKEEEQMEVENGDGQITENKEGGEKPTAEVNKEREEEEEEGMKEEKNDESPAGSPQARKKGGEEAEKKKKSSKSPETEERMKGGEKTEEKRSGESPRTVKKGETEERKEKEGPVKKTAAFSSFFTPKKAAVKLEKVEQTEEEKKPLPSEEKDSHSAKGAESVDQTQYDPSRAHYHPIDHACWGRGQKVPYLAVARTFEKIEEDSGRLRNIETLSNLLRSVILLSPDDLLCCVYLCLNQLGPAYQGLELGVGETVLMKAVAQATGRQLDKIKAEAQEKGDLGLVAESSRSNQRMMFAPANLTSRGVFVKLKEIASMSGNSAMNKKIDIIKGLFVACRHSEARYIIRSLAGKLRIGLAEQSVLAALSQAVCLTPPGQEFPPAVVDAGKKMSTESRKSWLEEKGLILKQTYCEMPNYDVIIPVLLKEGIDELPNQCKLTPGVPLKPMLAHPTKGVGEVMKRFDEAAFTCEYKYDGERAQIHILESGEVRIYSRNQEDNTTKYPDIIARIPQVKKASVVSCVLDSEAVAWDREKKQIQPFQVLTTRKRKDVDAADIKVQVCVYAFDLLYLNGKSLVREPLCARRALLRDSFEEQEGQFVFARSLDSLNTDAIAEFLEQSVRDSCEGLMVKTLERDATYEIAKRSHNWLKLKKDYLEGVGDTVDLCVVGAYLGKGKRAGGYGGFLLACYDEDNEEFQSVCKIGTGFKDEDLEQHYNFLKEHILPKARPYYRVDQSAEPDVWLDAVQVWEVKCADLSLSPVYKAGMGLVDPEKGISLRFPRFLRIRDDKKPEDATSASQVADLYKRQQQIQNQGDKSGDLEDYY